MQPVPLTTLPSTRPQPIQAYFSHSYRADDRSVNLFFWRLFSAHGFFFTVDPKSERTFIPHLERMLCQSDCFIAVVTRRRELVYSVGGVMLAQPQVVWNYSPYIALENRLAYRSTKPRLIFVENGLDPNLFGLPDEVHTFDRDLLEKREHLYSNQVARFAARVRDYKHFSDRSAHLTRKAGIMLDVQRGQEGYSSEVVALIKEALRAGGYTAHMVTPSLADDQQFVRDLSDLDLLVAEVREPWTPPLAQVFAHARFIPLIRLCRLLPGESLSSVVLPEFLQHYSVGDLQPVATWRTPDELAFEIIQHMQKFQQPRTLLDTLDAGRRYFLSAGRRPAKVFVSNAHTLNNLGMELIRGFQTANIQFFHYQASLRIGSAWQEELQRELDTCDVFVSLINEDYHTSRWCQYELDHAFERWKRREVTILPYLTAPTKLPDTIRDSIQCAFVGNLPHKELVATIIATVDRLLTQIDPAAAPQSNEIDAMEDALEGLNVLAPSQNFAETARRIARGLAQIGELSYSADEQLTIANDIAWTHLGMAGLMGDLPTFPERLPLIIARSPAVEQIVDAIKQQLANQPARVALLVTAAGAPSLEVLRRELNAQVRQVHACDIVLITPRSLNAIVRDGVRATALRRMLLANVTIANYAPFVISGSTPDHMFFGREAELRSICEQVRLRSFAVIGGRRIGKTSLMRRLHRVRLPAIGFRSIYLDCSTITNAQALLHVPLGDCRPAPAGVEPTLAELLEEPGRMRAFTADRPLVLLLDEADRLVAADRAEGWRFFSELRAVVNRGGVQVVLGGERALREALRDPSGPLFNFVNETLIGRLDRHSTEELVVGPLRQLHIEIEEPEAIVRRIYEFTSGHPNVIQRLCHRLVTQLDQQGTRALTQRLVNETIESPEFIRKDFLDTYFSRASTLEHLCAMLMADDSELRTLAAVHGALERYEVAASLNQVHAALERLVDLRNILEHTRDGYQFAVTAFPLIIAQSRLLADWIHLRREVFVQAGDVMPEMAPPELQARIW
jgi:hypothetical protein